MRITRLNHVAIHAVDLSASVRFYTELFRMEPIATYTFAFPAQFLALGEQQLHIFERPTDSPTFHHVAFDVDCFEEVYRVARDRSLHDSTAFFSDVYELPDGSVQMYLRDPAGNLVEIDWPDVTTLDRSVLPPFKRLQDSVPQTPEGRRATLYRQRV